MNATDRSHFRRHALFAARSVTLALALGACESSRTLHPNDKEDTGTNTQDSDTLASTDETDAPDETDAVTDTVETDDTNPVEETDDTVPSGEPDCATDGLDMVACCDARHAWCGEGFAADSEAYNDCVFGPGYDGSTGCIPWGPPVPPRARALA